MAKSFIGRGDLPLGLRNNNPGNLRPYETWQGQTGTYPASCPDPDNCFIVFKDIAWGLRAMATDLGNDIRKKKLNTISKLVSEYAPGRENPTQQYISYVSDSTGIAPNEPIEPTLLNLKKLMRAHLEFENGIVPASMITDADIDEGLSLMNSGLLSFFRNITENVTAAVKQIETKVEETIQGTVSRHPARVAALSMTAVTLLVVGSLLLTVYWLKKRN